jgi:hypothetical protein
MRKTLFFATLAILFSMTCFMTSCTQEQLTTDSDLVISAGNETQASSISDDVINVSDEYTTGLAQNGYKISSSAMKVSGITSISTVTITIDKPDSVNFPKVITIDFGTSGFTGRRGNVYKGKLIITISNKLTIANAYYSIKTSNFYVNDNKVGGVKTVTYKGLINVTHPYWTIVTKDTITRTDKTVVTWASERVRERLEINGTPLIPWDDTFSIKGNAKGINSKGSTYSMVIDNSNPLIVGNLCPYIRKGTVTITENTKSVVIDYGNGDCDDLATATYNGITKTFKLNN